MEINAINTFRKVLDDSDNILKNIRIEVFLKLNLGSYEQLNEFVRESLEHFFFNIIENDFFNQIRNVVNEAMDKNTLKIKNGETVDYNLFSSDLISQLKKIGQVDFSFDDDFKNLAKNINSKFPLIASDDWYARLSSKKEQIVSMINKYNQDVVETLIRFTPQLASELSALDSIAKTNLNDNQVLEPTPPQRHEQQTLLSTSQAEKKESISTQVPVSSSNTDEIHQVESVSQIHSNESSIQKNSKSEQSTIQSPNEELIDNLLAKCGEIYREISSKFASSNDSKYKKDISKGLHQMEKFIWNLKNQTFAQEVFERYYKLNNADKEIIYDDIIFQNVPMLKELYENSNNLNNEEKRPIEPEPKAPDSVETYIGATNEDVTELIKQNKYFSLLQSIKKEDVMKYSGFIYTGYHLMIDDWYKKASACKTYEEQHDAYFKLYDIYQNFRDYLSLEQSKQLREQLNSIQRYLNEQRKMTDDAGVRYNTEAKEEKFAMHR